ncbi:MAG: phosphatase PAP2 family protein [Bacteroidota bacterium]
MPNRNYYLIPYIILFLLTLLVWSLIDHGDEVLFLNLNRNAFFDAFFKIWTYMGDGIFVGICMIALVIWRWRLAVVFAVLGLAQFIFAQGLKRLVFSDVPRPVKYFSGLHELNLIEGVQHHGSFSFPSGHTITAFAVATFFAIVFRNNKAISILVLIGAILVGLSRIYLLQHFLRDVLAGSLIGVVIAIGVFLLFQEYVYKDKLKQ